MTLPWRAVLAAAFVGAFLALATVALNRPGFYYDEVIFVPVSLRALGQCDVDAAVSKSTSGCFPVLQAPPYVGAAKAWLHAPVFAWFGIDAWTVRLPSILIGALALLVLWRFAFRELGTAWSLVVLALTATDPVFISHARLDWGPAMIGTLMRLVALATLWRWLHTGRIGWLAGACAACTVGFIDKLNFLWTIGALGGAALIVCGRQLRDRLRNGAPWQPLLAGATAALLAWNAVKLARIALALDVNRYGGDTLAGQVAKVWQLYAETFSGTSVLGWVYGIDVPVTRAFNYLLLGQLGVAVVLLAWRRPWTQPQRLLAFLSVAIVILLAAMVATPQTGGTHHLIMVWPLPTLHLVTLLAIAARRPDRAGQPYPTGPRASLAVAAAAVCGALFAWNLGISLRYAEAWRQDHDFAPRFDPAIARLAQRLAAADVDRIHAADWGLHQSLVTLGGRERAARHREWSWELQEAAAARDGADARLGAEVAGKRVAFVLFAPQYTVFAGARSRVDGFLARHRPCGQREERIANSAGRPLYVVVVADYASCGAGAATSPQG